MTSVCDTRFLLAFRFPPSQELREKARTMLEGELRREMVIPAVVVAEYVKVAGSRVGSEAALVHISELEARGAYVSPISREVAATAGKLLLSHPATPMADALVGATAKTTRADYVLSDDPHFKTLGVKTRWF